MKRIYCGYELELYTDIQLEQSDASDLEEISRIGHFRVLLCLCRFKTNLSLKPFI